MLEKESKSKDGKLILNYSEDNYGPILPYIIDDRYTDVDFNGRDVWLTDFNNIRKKIDGQKIGMTQEFAERLAQKISNLKGEPVNRMHPVLEAETEERRFSIINNSVAASGLSICVRQIPSYARITANSAIESGYCSEDIMNLLANCVKAHMNIVFCGEPRVGKTECGKFFSQFIPKDERVITVEDVLEWHYGNLNPGADFVELEVSPDSDIFDYSKALIACLKHNPAWIILTEIRGNEVKYLLKGFQTGVNGMSTLHTDDLRNAIQRMLNMADNVPDLRAMENNLYENINVGVLLDYALDSNGNRHRRIEQIAFYFNEDGSNYCRMIVNQGEFISKELPMVMMEKMQRANILDPYQNENVKKRLEVGQ